MGANFILDTSYIGGLNAVSKFALTTHYIPYPAMPVSGLHHLLVQGATLVLPNKVLEEATYTELQRDEHGKVLQYRSLGLGCAQDGTVDLDIDALKQSNRGNSAFLKYLRAEYRAGNVVCFRSSDA